MTEHWDVAILGAGAAGLAAAVTLGQMAPHAGILVLEQGDRPGKKLLATGNGRCNLYQTSLSAHRFTSVGEKDPGAWISAVLAADQPGFWDRLGLLTIQQEEGRVYPLCQQATAVTELLRLSATAAGVVFRCQQRVNRLERTQKGFRIATEGGTICCAHQVILATGGLAAPKLGATGDGFDLAKGLGHSCTACYPGLVPIRTVNPGKVLKGVRNRCKVSLYLGERLLLCRGGEVQFTEYGVSGIVMMDISSHMQPGLSYQIRLDLLPELEAPALLSCLEEKCKNHPRQRGEFLLLGIVKQQLGEVVLRAGRVDGKRRTLDSITRQELENLVRLLKGWTLRTEGTLSWDHAQITCGGIPLREVEEDSFRSALVPGLYITGELLDVAGDCGGYNLSWAFGSGILAARDCAKRL